jgi:hypothetical protein
VRRLLLARDTKYGRAFLPREHLYGKMAHWYLQKTVAEQSNALFAGRYNFPGRSGASIGETPLRM